MDVINVYMQRLCAGGALKQQALVGWFDIILHIYTVCI